MSSGSYFTLYRKYNNKASDEIYNSIVKQYLEEFKTSSMKDDMSDSELLKELPIVLDLNYGVKESKYDDGTKQWIDIVDHSIDGQRKQFYSILQSDKSYLDELLQWNFGSNFTALKSHWNLNQYNLASSQHVIDKLLAEKILQACNYLLSGKWSDEFEKILNNSWIRTLTENECDNYWKYVYRNDKKKLQDCIDNESNESAEYDLKLLQSVLSTFASIETDYSKSDIYDMILVYTVW